MSSSMRIEYPSRSDNQRSLEVICSDILSVVRGRSTYAVLQPVRFPGACSGPAATTQPLAVSDGVREVLQFSMVRSDLEDPLELAAYDAVRSLRARAPKDVDLLLCAPAAPTERGNTFAMFDGLSGERLAGDCSLWVQSEFLDLMTSHPEPEEPRTHAPQAVSKRLPGEAKVALRWGVSFSEESLSSPRCCPIESLALWIQKGKKRYAARIVREGGDLNRGDFVLEIGDEIMNSLQGITLTIGSLEIEPSALIQVVPGATISIDNVAGAISTLMIDGERWADVELQIVDGKLQLAVKDLYQLPTSSREERAGA